MEYLDQMLLHIELSSKYLGAWVHIALLKENKFGDPHFTLFFEKVK